MDTFRDLFRFSLRIDFLGMDASGVNRDRRRHLKESWTTLSVSLSLDLLRCNLIDFVGLEFVISSHSCRVAATA
ncbi:hypothetical protein X777_01811 [Ooceraea biroi]|uniref:Uncharacterized protein n=1 Tax=Ooceraea biroi TaxID=2015173 RepID=A0A026WMF4_OOCBI|nr:hypothetical protein X777_01811 [Ooceraea biroi]